MAAGDRGPYHGGIITEGLIEAVIRADSIETRIGGKKVWRCAEHYLPCIITELSPQGDRVRITAQYSGGHAEAVADRALIPAGTALKGITVWKGDGTFERLGDRDRDGIGAHEDLVFACLNGRISEGRE